MLGPGGFLIDRERPLKQRLRLGKALLLHIKRGEIVEGPADIGMLARQAPFADGERALEQRLGFSEAALPLI